jgi:hypothetical protein
MASAKGATKGAVERDPHLRRESVLKVVKKLGLDRRQSIVPESGVLLDHADVAPSPCRDYCQIIVTSQDVSFRFLNLIHSLRELFLFCSDFHETYFELYFVLHHLSLMMIYPITTTLFIQTD